MLGDQRDGLMFVGIGPRGIRGVPPAAFTALRTAYQAFVDNYTAKVPEDTLQELQKARYDPILRLDRARLEQGDEVLHAARQNGGAVLLVVGDPMAATTHVSLRLRALREGTPVYLLFAPSVTHTALSEAGLQHYKMGRTVSIPFPAKGFAPTSPLERIGENRAAGLHTLVLLDLRPEEGRYMTAREGIAALLEMGTQAPAAAIGADTLVVAVERAGEADARVHAGAARRLLTIEYGPPMHCLIVPGALHFEEREALHLIGGALEAELPPP